MRLKLHPRVSKVTRHKRTGKVISTSPAFSARTILPPQQGNRRPQFCAQDHNGILTTDGLWRTPEGGGTHASLPPMPRLV